VAAKGLYLHTCPGSSEEDLQDSKKIRNRKFIRVACGIMVLAIVAYGYDFVA